MMKTKHFLFALAVVFIGNQSMLLAQTSDKQMRGERKRPTVEQMQEMQRNRIIKELALDDATSAKFAAVYQKYQDEMRSVFPVRNGKVSHNQSADRCVSKPQLTDAEVERAMKERFAQSRKTLDIREKYYDEFRKILSPKQVQKVYSLERRKDNKAHRGMNFRSGMKKMHHNGKAVQERHS